MRKNLNNHIIALLMRLHSAAVSKYDESFLEKSLQKRMTETHCASVEEYSSFLEQNKYEP
jgi:chemotaxis methyl-accepting protein methylase